MLMTMMILLRWIRMKPLSRVISLSIKAFDTVSSFILISRSFVSVFLTVSPCLVSSPFLTIEGVGTLIFADWIFSCTLYPMIPLSKKKAKKGIKSREKTRDSGAEEVCTLENAKLAKDSYLVLQTSRLSHHRYPF